jgi:hypothetical protein
MVYSGEPAGLLQQIAGRVFEGLVPRDQVEDLTREHPVASAVITGEPGRYRVRLVLPRDQAPPPAFQAVMPTLEDGYFATGPALAGALEAA